jgi:hypothetical protein
MTAPEQEPDCRSVDRILCLIACFFLALFMVLLTTYVVCSDNKCPVFIEAGPIR